MRLVPASWGNKRHKKPNPSLIAIPLSALCIGFLVIEVAFSISSGKGYDLPSLPLPVGFSVGSTIEDKPFPVCIAVLAASNLAFRPLSQMNKAGTAIPINIATVKTTPNGTGN